MSFFFSENGTRVSDWNVVDSIFQFNPFAVKINPFVFKSIRFLIILFLNIYSIQSGTNSVEQKYTKILAPKGS